MPFLTHFHATQTQDGQQDHQLTTTDSEGRARTSVCGAASLRDESSSPSSGTAVSPSAASFSSVNGTALPLKSKGRISANFSQNPLHPAELKGTATVAASRRVAFACEDEDEDEAPHREDRRSTLGDVGECCVSRFMLFVMRSHAVGRTNDTV